jgi:hypothetical protein
MLSEEIGGLGVIRYIYVIAICLLSFETSSFAQTSKNPGLRGLSALGLVVEGLDDDSGKCGITEDVIRDAFLYIATSAKFRVTTERYAPQFIVHVTTLIQRNPRQCVTNLAIEVAKAQTVTLEFGDKLSTSVWVQLWRDDWIAVSVAERHRQQVQNGVEGATKKFIAAWTMENKVDH